MSTPDNDVSFLDFNSELNRLFDDDFEKVEDLTPLVDFQTNEIDSSQKRRSSKDFNPDMDTLVISAHATFVIEALSLFSKGDFSEKSIAIYSEAQSCMGVLIKILERSPSNNYKLQILFNADAECMEIEKTAFGLFQKKNKVLPKDNGEKILAFQMMQGLFRNGLIRARIAQDIELLRQFCFSRGIINPDLVIRTLNNENNQCAIIVKSLQQTLPQTIHIVNKGIYITSDTTKEKKTYISFIINSSLFLFHFFNETGAIEECTKYLRIHDTYQKGSFNS
jgi:hypothetical protein